MWGPSQIICSLHHLRPTGTILAYLGPFGTRKEGRKLMQGLCASLLAPPSSAAWGTKWGVGQNNPFAHSEVRIPASSTSTSSHSFIILNNGVRLGRPTSDLTCMFSPLHMEPHPYISISAYLRPSHSDWGHLTPC